MPLSRVNRDGKIYALLATARIANVPSVVSNLGVGVLLGSLNNGGDFSWPWLLMIAAVAFYVAGNFLNDWADREWDMANRPERALPRGLFRAHHYLVFASVGMAAGMGLAALHGWRAVIVSAALAGFIVLYTKVHKRAAWSVIPMGLCRACLPVLGFAGGSWQEVKARAKRPTAIVFFMMSSFRWGIWTSNEKSPDRFLALFMAHFHSRAALHGDGAEQVILPDDELVELHEFQHGEEGDDHLGLGGGGLE